MPMTDDGTVTVAPVTPMVTVLPTGSLLPAVGDWLTTVLAGAPGDWAATTSTLNPSPFSSAIALDRVWPFTSGTFAVGAGFGPSEATMLTALPLASDEPKPGLVEITRPLATAVDCLVVTVPTLSPTRVMASSAAAT